DAGVELLQGDVTGGLPISAARAREQLARGAVVDASVLPTTADLPHQRFIPSPRAIRFLVAVGGVLIPAVRKGIGQRAEDRFGMLPTDGLQRAPGVGNIDRLVADVAEVPRAVTAEDLEDGIRALRAGEPRHGRVDGFWIPAVHSLRKG